MTYRKCLRCDKSFDSIGCENRLCRTCRETNSANAHKAISGASKRRNHSSTNGEGQGGLVNFISAVKGGL